MAFSQENDVAGPGSAWAAFSRNDLPICNQATLDEKIYVKVYFHIINQDDGTGGYPLSRLDYTKARMDAVFNPHDIYFLYDCYVDVIDNTDLYNSRYSLTQNEIMCLWKMEHQGKEEDGLHINLIFGGSGTTGLAGGIGSNWLVAVGDLTTPGIIDPDQRLETSVLHHEIGHCFGLYHLHRGYSKNPMVNPNGEVQETYYDCQTGEILEYPGLIAERVNHSNDVVAGDLVENTDASNPYFEICNSGSTPDCLWGTHETWVSGSECVKKPNSYLVVDPNGEVYHPQPDNFMLIAMPAECRTDFTLEVKGQVCRMKNHLIYDPVLALMTRPEEIAIQTCGCADQDWVLDPGVTNINSNMDLTGNMIIPAGAEVTISAKVTFLPGASVYVERGARLNIVGGRLTSFCPHSYWKGVRVQGSRYASQPNVDAALNPNQAGIVRMMYGGTIELAETGIYTWDERLGWPTYADYFGGLIDASNAYFINNKRAVAFMKYELPNKSKFRSCLFETNNSMPQGVRGYGVTVWDCGNLSFENCTFNNLQVGIAGIDFESIVKGSSKFDNCVTGIGASTTYPFGGVIDVQSTSGGDVHFINNRTGISARGPILQTSNASFVKNGQYIHSNDAVGVELLGPTNFEIRASDFDNMNAGISFRNVGDMEGFGKMECNTFVGDDKEKRVGIFGHGVNSKVDFQFNTFDINDLCQPEILLMKNGTNGNVVRPFIGEDGIPADNCFSQNGKLEIQTIGNVNAFQYFIPQQGIPCEYPHDNLSDAGANNYTTSSTPRNEGNCRYSAFVEEETYTSALFEQILGALEEFPVGGDGSAAYYILLKKKDEIRAYLIREFRENNNNTGIVQLLNQENSISALRLLYGHYVYTNQLELAMQKLLTLPNTSDEDQAFRQVQLINLDRLDESQDFNLSYPDYFTLITIAQSDVPSAYYAQSLLQHLVSEEFMEDDVPTCGAPLRRAVERVNDDHQVEISPNPSLDRIYLMYTHELSINQIKVYDLGGKLNMQINEIESMVDVSSLKQGMYFISIEFEDGQVDYQTFVKID